PAQAVLKSSRREEDSRRGASAREEPLQAREDAGGLLVVGGQVLRGAAPLLREPRKARTRAGAETLLGAQGLEIACDACGQEVAMGRRAVVHVRRHQRQGREREGPACLRERLLGGGGKDRVRGRLQGPR